MRRRMLSEWLGGGTKAVRLHRRRRRVVRRRQMRVAAGDVFGGVLICAGHGLFIVFIVWVWNRVREARWVVCYDISADKFTILF